MLKFNKKEIKQKQFAFDGCHKIYLLEDNEIDSAKEMGYEIFPIEKLAEKYICSCCLRFIDTWNDLSSVIPQCESKIEIEDNGKMLNVDFTTDTVNSVESYQFAKTMGWTWLC